MLFLSFFSNLLLSLLKIIVGFLGNSKSLVADGIHSLSDLATDIIAICGSRFSKKPADEEHPYGHGKMEYITSIGIGIIILCLGMILFRSSFEIVEVVPDGYTLFVVFITIILKYWVSKKIIDTGKKVNSYILITSGKESKMDLYSSILVFFLLIGTQFSSVFPVLRYMDILGSVVISIVIIVVGLNIIKENISILLEEDDLSLENIKVITDIVKSVDDKIVINVLHLLKYGVYYKLHMTLLLDEKMTLLNAHVIFKKIKKKLRNSELNIKYIVIDFTINGSEKNARKARSNNCCKKVRTQIKRKKD